MHRQLAPRLLILSLLAAGAFWACSGSSDDIEAGSGTRPDTGEAPTAEAPVEETGESEAPVEVAGPGAAAVDVFHPDREQDAEVFYGGRVIVHLSSLPESICYPIENSAVTRRLLYEVHETLLIQDWEWHDYRPRLAESFVTEDLLVLTAEAAGRHGDGTGAIDAKVRRQGQVAEGQSPQKLVRAYYGQISDSDGGDAWVVTPISSGSSLGAAVQVPKTDVESIQRGAVFTFRLRAGVLWHPSVLYPKTHPEAAAALEGHTLDAADVLFSWTIYSNPKVDCDEKRFQFEKITHGEVIDDLTVRFFYQEQYAFAKSTIGDSLTILPSHIYNLSDPDNPDYDPKASAEKRGKHINENRHNQLWVGLGPYRVTQWTQQYVQAERFADEDGNCLYFDRDNAGYVDTIRWRYIDDDETSMNALLNGELDYFERIKSADYFGARTEGDNFKATHYKGYKYLGSYGYTGWNLYKPQLKDLAVRKAISMAMDYEAYRISNYKGLARRITGPFPYNSAAYDHDVKPLPFDPEGAIDLLEEAEWYDRDGDGIRDKDGVALEIDFLMPSGNVASKLFGLKLQEALGALEIKVNIVQMEWATFLEKMKTRQFDAVNLAWVPELESDPEQLWHSKWGEYDARGSNNAGVMDAQVDAMIATGQRELDFDKRQAIWREMHRYLYENVHPYLFMYNVPQKFALNRRFRGFQMLAIDPGYSIRRWHLWQASDGTRKTLDS